MNKLRRDLIDLRSRGGAGRGELKHTWEIISDLKCHQWISMYRNGQEGSEEVGEMNVKGRGQP